MITHGCGNVACQVCYGHEDFIDESKYHAMKLKADAETRGLPARSDRVPQPLTTREVLRMKQSCPK